MRAAERQETAVHVRAVTSDATVSLDLVETHPIDRPIVRPRGGRGTETIAVRTVVAAYAPDSPTQVAYDMGGFLLRADGSPTSATRWIKGAALDDVPEPVRPWAERAAYSLRRFFGDVDVLALHATGALSQRQP